MPHIITHECTELFDINITFVRYLGDKYNIETMFICPHQVGMPMTRKRRYTVMHLKGSVTFSGLESHLRISTP
jgi:hypothetical protein